MDFLILILSVFLLFRGNLDWVLFFLLMLTTRYFGTVSNISPFLMEHNISDLGLVLFLIMFLYVLHKKVGKLPKVTTGKYLILFYLFLLISIFTDLVINDIDLVSVIKTSRHWIFLSCIWIFGYFPPREIEKLMRYLLVATAVVSAIILIEFFFNIKIIGIYKPEELTSSGDALVRSSIPSSFAFFFTLLLFTDYFKLTKKVKYSLIVLLTATIVFSMIRSAIVELVIGVMFLFVIREKMKLRNIVFGSVAILTLMLIVIFNPNIKDRFISGVEEVRTFNLTNSEVQGNLTYRIFHAQERIRYISQSLQYSVFGIGNITEENFPEYFTIGLVSEEGRTSQLDTGDIAWSIFFLRLGFVGTLLFLVFYVKVIFDAFGFRRQSDLAAVLFVYLLIELTLGSLTSTSIAKGSFWLFPLLIYCNIKPAEDE
jgi:hypothetical protein